MDRDVVIRTLVSDRAKLLAYAWAIVQDDHAAEDLYQETFVVAMDRPDTFRDELHVLKWSRVTLRNKALEHLRQARRSPVVLTDELLNVLEEKWARRDSAPLPDITDALRSCLNNLTTNARLLIGMRYGKGMRGTDIADNTGRTVHSVYVALSRAYKTLGDCINARFSGEEANA